jgi:hypothetical protein
MPSMLWSSIWKCIYLTIVRKKTRGKSRASAEHTSGYGVIFSQGLFRSCDWRHFRLRDEHCHCIFTINHIIVGYWYMHFHIELHNIDGMALILKEGEHPSGDFSPGVTLWSVTRSDQTSRDPFGVPFGARMRSLFTGSSSLGVLFGTPTVRTRTW